MGGASPCTPVTALAVRLADGGPRTYEFLAHPQARKGILLYFGASNELLPTQLSEQYSGYR